MNRKNDIGPSYFVSSMLWSIFPPDFCWLFLQFPHSYWRAFGVSGACAEQCSWTKITSRVQVKIQSWHITLPASPSAFAGRLRLMGRRWHQVVGYSTSLLCVGRMTACGIQFWRVAVGSLGHEHVLLPSELAWCKVQWWKRLCCGAFWRAEPDGGILAFAASH